MTVRSGDTQAAEGEAPTLFVVDGDAAVRAALARAAASVELRAEGFRDGAAALAGIDRERAGCLVLDLRLPDGDGFALIDALRERGVVLPVIMATAFADVPTAVRALRAGVYDFFEKPVSAQALLERVQAAIVEDAAERESGQRLLDFAGRLARLTPREREVLALVIAGGSSRSIAGVLALSPKTVETHRAKLMAKTGVSSLAELIRLGLLVRLQAGSLAGDPLAAYGTPPQGGSRR
ncbi:response regulator transcription factor [bacterium]|nr:response regulator transcription factor [bacterium]